MSDGLALFPEDERCPGCGLDPCGCGVDLPGSDDPDVDFRNIEAVAAIVRATPVAAHPEQPLSLVEAAPVEGRTAFAAFIDRRDELRERHGDKAVTDPTRTPSALAHDLKERACAVLDRLSGREPDAERAGLALNTLATIGAIALTLHERLATIADARGPLKQDTSA